MFRTATWPSLTGCEVDAEMMVAADWLGGGRTRRPLHVTHQDDVVSAAAACGRSHVSGMGSRTLVLVGADS